MGTSQTQGAKGALRDAREALTQAPQAPALAACGLEAGDAGALPDAPRTLADGAEMSSTHAASDVLAHPPAASSPAVRKCMQGNKRRDTSPELAIRAMLRELGYPGYRLDWKKAPGHPDIAYPGRRIAIFAMGCFWHACPVCKLPTPKSNVEYWQAKFARNVERDARTRAALEELGWTVVTVWEHELRKDCREHTRRRLYEAVKRAGDPPYEVRFPS